MSFKNHFNAYILSLLLLAFPALVTAVTINVPADQSTIQAGIDAAISGVDEVVVAPGFYVEAINFNGKAITVRSSGGAGLTTISGAGNFHVILCAAGEGAGTVLQGFTITGGNANGPSGIDKIGGGILNLSSSPTIIECTFAGNLAERGGAMNNQTANPTITRCSFISNTASIDGGGIFNFNSSPVISECTFSNNSGGIGGGMTNKGGGSPSVTNCAFRNNSAVAALGSGGGILAVDGSLTVSLCTFNGNSANNGGGGGIVTDNSSLVISNSIFWNNSDVGGIDESAQIQVNSGSATVNYSNILGGWSGSGANNINADPLFVNAAGGDLHLQACSPSVDSGNNGDIPGGVTTDLDGNARIVNGTVDMGAYETQVFNDSDGDGVDDACDLCPGFDDNIDSDGDDVADGCDSCPGFDDNGPDTDGDGIPDACDTKPVHNLTQATDHFTIQLAINAAVDGDVLEVDPGTYFEGIDFNTRTITLRSASGNPNDTIIDGTGHFHVVLTVSSGSPTLRGFTLTGGDANGVSPPNVFGGGMYNDGTSPTVIDCIFSQNASAVEGGGMYNVNANTTVINCVFDQNTAHTSGGAMFNNSSDVAITNSTFTGNAANNTGGALYNESSSLTITNTVFSGNASHAGGGAAGGAIYNILPGTHVVTNCTFSANVATGGGNGGGVLTLDSDPVFTNCIFWENADSGGMDASAQIQVLGGSPTLNFSNLQGGWTGSGSNNINADPLFVDADGTDNIAGTADDDLNLQPGSPCIDAGDSSQIPAGIITDLGGGIRIVNDPATANTGVGSCSVVDMGAFEFQTGAVDANADGVEDGCNASPVRNITQATNFFAIQTAIDAAINGDVIEADPGTYMESIDFMGKAITVRSASGDPNDTIIDGTGNVHVVQCDSGEDPNTILQGFTVTGGNANDSFPDSNGGGMYNDGSSPMVVNCVFAGNQAADSGGGMFNDGGSPTVIDCNFSGNSAAVGGAICNDPFSSPTLTNCVFLSNIAGSGGAIYSRTSTSAPVMIGCTFNGNTADSGGALRNDASSPTVTNCIFSGNTANGDGGGMQNVSSSPVVTNCTFSGNTATNNGGGMTMISGSPTVTNCIFWNNSDGGGIDESAQIYEEATFSHLVTYSLVMGGWTGTGSNNINTDPVFVDAHGADSIVGTDDDDLSLQAGSPCIDAGDTTVVSELTDLGGNPRTIDDPDSPDTGVSVLLSSGLVTVDMGAYESQVIALCSNGLVGDLNCDGIVDVFDFALMALHWLETL